MAFLTAAAFLYPELKRRQRLGYFKTFSKETIIGEAPKLWDVLLNALLGFVLGYKILGLMGNPGALENPQHWLLSGDGNLLGGIAGGIIMGFWRWYEKHSVKLPSPVKEAKTMWPHDMIGDIVLFAAIGGISGAKFFYLFETPGNFQDFLQDPLGSFFGGLAIWGGIVGGALVVSIFAYRRNINILQLCDATAPTLLIALAVGRIGCQVAGDGDWGIYNTQPKPGWLSWLPDSLWAYDYAHNVNRDGAGLIQNCQEAYCTYVTPLVYPTPIYEIVMLTILFAILWAFRKKLVAPGAMFSLYFIVSGVERILIEQIRINTKLNILGMQLTQAEFLSIIFMVGGTIGLIIALQRHRKNLREKGPDYLVIGEKLAV
ncbi:MAG: prolipoprotein diacylglyceryl transferase [Chitinophagales bacterium]|nr:prolipoprotein diacylglyceryl transferase [Chitinophagales bacterium]